MRPIIIIFLIFLISCDKESKKMVRIRGNVYDMGKLGPADSIHVGLFRSSAYDSQNLLGPGYIAVSLTDEQGNYDITAEVSDAFPYILKVTDSREIFWLNYPDWGIFTFKEMEYHSIFTVQDFTIARKAELHLVLNYPQPIDTNGLLILNLFKPDGNPYITDYYLISNGIDIDISNLQFFTVDLIEGEQHLELNYSLNGNDTLINVDFELIPGQENEVMVDLY